LANSADQNLIRTPLTGKYIKVVDVKGGTYKGLKGLVVEERMNVIRIDNEGEQKLIPKKVCIFELMENGKTLGQIRGEDIIGRPETRCL